MNDDLVLGDVVRHWHGDTLHEHRNGDAGHEHRKKRMTWKSWILAALILAAAGCASVAAAPSAGPSLSCQSARMGTEWWLDVSGPGVVHQVTARGRTMRLPHPVALPAGMGITVDWSGAYAPDPGRCTAR